MTSKCRTVSPSPALGDRLCWRVAQSLNDAAKSLQDDGGVVIDRERGVTERLPHFVALPKLLVCSPPFANGAEPLTLVSGVRIPTPLQQDHRDTCDLNDRDRLVVRIDHH